MNVQGANQGINPGNARQLLGREDDIEGTGRLRRMLISSWKRLILISFRREFSASFSGVITSGPGTAGSIVHIASGLLIPFCFSETLVRRKRWAFIQIFDVLIVMF